MDIVKKQLNEVQMISRESFNFEKKKSILHGEFCEVASHSPWRKKLNMFDITSKRSV